jgi:hypothetical protein
MGENGLLEQLDNAWVEHVSNRADVRALVRIMRDGEPFYLIFSNPLRHEQLNGNCSQIKDAYGGSLRFEVQVLNEQVYAETRPRLEPKIQQGTAVILYEKGQTGVLRVKK